jgi:hypothetical protein
VDKLQLALENFRRDADVKCRAGHGRGGRFVQEAFKNSSGSFLLPQEAKSLSFEEKPVHVVGSMVECVFCPAQPFVEALAAERQLCQHESSRGSNTGGERPELQCKAERFLGFGEEVHPCQSLPELEPAVCIERLFLDLTHQEAIVPLDLCLQDLR